MDLKDKTILVCDDSILARKQIKDAINLCGEGANYVEAANGQDALEQYKSCSPDLVFLDIVMPVMDGTTAIEKIIEHDKDAKIVVVSSVGTQEQLKKAIAAGAKDFVQKPIDPNQIKSIVSSRL